MAEPVTLRPVPAETVAQRVRALQAEAKSLARQHTETLSAAMCDLENLAREIADGGDAYAPGARQIASTLAEDLASRIQTLAAIMGKAS